jgi:serine/threonine protein kinase
VADTDTLIGQTVSHYRIIEKLGGGGMGVVYKAEDTRLHRNVALKFLPETLAKDPQALARFQREAQAASALNHPNICTIHDVGEENGRAFIAMEYVAGKTLDQWIGHKRLRLSEALKYAIQIADALAAAHADGIVHRDLKPSNLIVSDSGLLKVLDFGLAKLSEKAASGVGETETLGVPASGTEEGTIVGTIAYMSPEQAEGKKVDSRSDIFSFGSVMYEMVTGKCAFRADSKLSTLSAILKDEPKPMSSLMPDVPRELEKVISRCLRKDPARRFQHMDDLKVALLDLKEESESGKLQGVAELGGRGRSKSLLGWAAGLIVLILIAAGGLWLRFFHRAANSGTPPRIVPLTSHAGNECCPSFSADGNQVAFVWNGPKQDKRTSGKLESPSVYV